MDPALFASGRPTAPACVPHISDGEPSLLGTGRGYFVEVHGESFRQEALSNLFEAQGQVRDCIVMLAAEPEHPQDSNAVAIYTLDEALLGYIPREIAPRYQQLFLQLAARGEARPRCRAKIFGLLLDLETPTRLASRLNLQYKRVKKRSAG